MAITGTGALVEPIRVKGLRDFQAALKAMDGESQKMLRVTLNEAAELVVSAAKPRVPSRTGAARSTVKGASSQREARVKAGSARVPYYGFLDFGGRVGRGRTGPKTGSVNRPFLTEGRYIYPAVSAVRPRVMAAMEKGLADLAAGAGLEVT
jgi:Bacteriophage HK97-gp10, putative tail-component